MRNRPSILILILSLLATFTGACDGPSGQSHDIAAIDAATTTRIDAAVEIDARSGGDPCALDDRGEPLDPEACSDCITNQLPPGSSDPCSTDGFDLDGAAVNCGAPQGAVFGFGGWKCARTIALAALAGGGVVGSAIGVGLACTAGQAAPGAGQLACIGAAIALAVTSGAYVIALIDIVTDCPWARARFCNQIRNLLARMQAGVAGLRAFVAALPPAVANAPIAGLVFNNPIIRNYIIANFPGMTVGQALNALLATFNGQIAQMQAALAASCANN